MFASLCARVGINSLCYIVRAIMVRAYSPGHFLTNEEQAYDLITSKHECKPRCFMPMPRTDPDIYICRYVGTIHHCGVEICNSTIITDESLVCTKTARCFEAPLVDHFPASDSADNVSTVSVRVHNPENERKRQLRESNNASITAVLENLRANLKRCSETKCCCQGPPKLLDNMFLFLRSAIEDTWNAMQIYQTATKRATIKTYNIDHHAFYVPFALRFGIKGEDEQTILPSVPFLAVHLPDAGVIIPKFVPYNATEPLHITWHTKTEKAFKLFLSKADAIKVKDMTDAIDRATRRFGIAVS
jgi:hypothetical protein